MLTPIAVAVVMTVVLATTAGVVAARMHGFDRTEAANIGFTVLTRGEFSIILASLAVAAGLDPRIGTLAAGYVLVLAIVGPIAAAQSRHTARLIPAFLCPPASHARRPAADLEVGTGSLYLLGTELLQVTVQPGSRLHGVYAGELRLPHGSTLGLLARAGSTYALQPTTQLRTDDVLLVFTEPDATGRRPRGGSSRSTAPAGWRTGTATRRVGPRCAMIEACAPPSPRPSTSSRIPRAGGTARPGSRP